MNYGVKLDWVNRMYTVLNVPENYVEPPYNTRKEDIDTIAENYIKEYLANLMAFLNSKGFNELVDFAQPVYKVDKYSYLIVLGFSQLDSSKVYINSIITFLTSSVILSTIIYFLVKHFA